MEQVACAVFPEKKKNMTEWETKKRRKGRGSNQPYERKIPPAKKLLDERVKGSKRESRLNGGHSGPRGDYSFH